GYFYTKVKFLKLIKFYPTVLITIYRLGTVGKVRTRIISSYKKIFVPELS
ncbi:unnamed protein product, partial [marine sediment metagenome]